MVHQRKRMRSGMAMQQPCAGVLRVVCELYLFPLYLSLSLSLSPDSGIA
jgi:hypothetical protein